MPAWVHEAAVGKVSRLATKRRTASRHGKFGRPGFRPASSQHGPLDGLSEAAESAPDCLLRRPHGGLRPALGGRERAVLGDEHPKSRDRLRDSAIGHVGQWDRLPVEYAGWVRIVGT
jgi:hypothetical protein